MTALSPRIPTKQPPKHQIKFSPRSNFNISPVTSTTLPLHSLNDYSIGSPRLNTLDSERSQNSARKKTIPVPSMKNNLVGGVLHSNLLAPKESALGLPLKEKKDVLKFFGKKGASKESGGYPIEIMKCYSTLITPRGEVESKSAREPEIKSHRSEINHDRVVKKERLLMSLIKKEAELNELRQSFKHGQDIKGEEKSQRESKKASQGIIERGTQTRTSMQNVDTIMEVDFVEDRKKKIHKGQHGHVGIPQLLLSDMSVDSRMYPVTNMTPGSLVSYSKLYTKANSRTSPNDIMQQLSARSLQRGESIVKTARIQTLKSIYDSQPDHRKSSKKFRLKRRPNNSLNRLVLAEGHDSSKDIKTERINVAKQSFVKGNIHKTVTTEADSKISNFSADSTAGDSSKKEKNNFFQNDLAGLLHRFKKLMKTQNDQKEELKEKTLTVIARITELESKGLLEKSENEST